MANTKNKLNNKKAKSAEVFDIIRSSAQIRSSIKQRLEKMGLSYSDLIVYAERDDITLDKPSLSRYLNNTKQVKGIPTQETILWICGRLKIKVNVNVE